MAELIFLGTGTSYGVPMLGCQCEVCLSQDGRNLRTRASVLVVAPAGNVLIDTSPELRIQLLRERIYEVHGVLYTHAHADHILGFDDLRAFSRRRGSPPVPIYCESAVEQTLRATFSYAFQPPEAGVSMGPVPRVEFHRIEPLRRFQLCGLMFLPLRVLHGKCPVLGFRFGPVAYCTDASSLPGETMQHLHGLDILVLNCLSYRSYPHHFSLDEALKVIRQLQPRRAYLTHLSHDFDHEKLSRELPPYVQPAYDGLRVDIRDWC
jgi:phosphoribosyl 1,2-cyclic phosphate phosphodiesterase